MNRNLALALAIFGVLCLLTFGSGVRPASATWQSAIDPQTYLRLRNEHIARLRGLSPGVAADTRRRGAAIEQLERQQQAMRQAAKEGSGGAAPEVIPVWNELGPRPLPNGETQQAGVTTPVTGRASSVVVDPTNSNKVYLGTAQGGVWRSLDGGATWTSIFDTAQSLAIGAMALAPSNPTTLYVGTGEHPGNEVNDTFFGVGVYRIDNVDAAATLVGPINPPFSFTNIFGQPTTTTCFAGRAINKITVHPTDPATIFVATTGSFSGISGQTLGSDIPPLGLRGLYRSTNATSAAASVTFQKMAVTTDASFDNPGTGNTGIWDVVFEPGNPNTILVTVAGSSPPVGGVFRSTNALAANPTFTQTLFPTLDPDGLAMRLAINKVGSVVTVYTTSNEPSSCPGQDGRMRKSIDGGLTWTDVPAADGFCGGSCIFDDSVAVDPNNANLVYLGGSRRGACADALKRSNDGGATFVRDDTGLNSGTHSIAVDTNTAPATIWVAGDSGVWKRQDAAPGTAWINRNNSALSTIQFQSVAVHPLSTNFTIGGTQDNGTVAQQTTPGTWTGAEGGDGGFALIDQSSINTTNVTMYHTFFNLSNVQIGFSRTNLGACLAVKDSWAFRGAGKPVDASASCDGTAKVALNGLNIADPVNFYAPMALGPGLPNRVYFGTDKLYRSLDKGNTMTVVSQNPLSGSSPVSAIGISPVNDNIRLVGMNNGKVFATITGSSTLTDISPSLPSDPNGDPSPNLKYISRLAVDPSSPNIAYITLSYYTPAGQSIFKTTNLNLTGTGTVTWTAMSSGIPSIPINAFVIDPANSNRLFAGTDIGVFVSEDGGTSWNPYGTGLPRVAVFDLAIQPTSHLMRAATHGRGMWEITASPPTAAPARISGRIVTTAGQPISGATITVTGGARTTHAITDGDGRYSVSNLDTGMFYTVQPALANYTFAPAELSFSLVADRSDAVFTGQADAAELVNPLDTAEYFVRQQYLDILNREPDQAGFEYWSAQLIQCLGDPDCLRSRRTSVASAFFIEQEFRQSGAYIYDVYETALGRRPVYAEYAADRAQVIGGPTLEQQKLAFAAAFVMRVEFANKYAGNNSAESFIDALLTNLLVSGIDLSSQRDGLLARYNTGASQNESRALVLHYVSESAAVRDANYNAAFVLGEYFGYLRRDPDQQGYNFWVGVLNGGGNYHNMVCAFITSTEYQRRFSSVVSHSNSECAE